MNPKPKKYSKGIHDHVSEMIMEFYDWRSKLSERPTIFSVKEKIESLNKDFLIKLRNIGWMQYDAYFMDSILFITGNDQKIQKHEEAQLKCSGWIGG
jgi:hypothetical protein